jgi:hypothetical protein
MFGTGLDFSALGDYPVARCREYDNGNNFQVLIAGVAHIMGF